MLPEEALSPLETIKSGLKENYKIIFQIFLNIPLKIVAGEIGQS